MIECRPKKIFVSRWTPVAASTTTSVYPPYTSRSWARAVRPPTRRAVVPAQFARLHVAELGPRSTPAYTSRTNVDGWAGGVIIKNDPTKTKLRTDARPSTFWPAYTSRKLRAPSRSPNQKISMYRRYFDYLSPPNAMVLDEIQNHW